MGSAAKQKALRTLLDDPARVHDGHAVGKVRHHGQIVTHIERRDAIAPAQLAHRFEHVGLGGHVKAGGGLVHDDHARTGGERDRERDALLLAARKLVRIPAQEGVIVGERDLVQHLIETRVPLRRGVAVVMYVQRLHQ